MIILFVTRYKNGITAFHRSSAVSGALVLLRAFCQCKIQHQERKCCVKGLTLKKMGGRERDPGRLYESGCKQWRSQSQIFRGRILWLVSNNILFGTLFVKSQNDQICKKCWGHDPLAPWLRLWLQEKNGKEQYLACLMFNLPLTKSSQQCKTARHCRVLVKSIGCYVWSLPTKLPANRDCLLKLYMLVKSSRTVSGTFYLEKRVYIGLRMVSWGCCQTTLVCKTCLHAVYHQSIAGVPTFLWPCTP